MNTNSKYLSFQTITAAVTIATVFTTLGYWAGNKYNEPINKIQYNKEWIGIWETNTDSYQNLRIIFHEEDNQIIGVYHHTSSNNKIIDGKITTKIDKYKIIGEWTEIINSKKIDGQIILLLSPDNKSFFGSYTRSWEGNKKRYVWYGLKSSN